MTKLRIFVFLLTIIVVGTIGTFLAFYARGYRIDLQTLKFAPNGILVVRSDPEAAQVLVDGTFRAATNANISLPPGTYKVTVKKDGYSTWEKTMVIEKEVVTEATITLFRTAPSLSPITFSPTQNPSASEDGSKIAYITPLDADEPEKSGLWIIETISLPLGFARDPKRITDGDLTKSTYQFSPDGREILLTKADGVFLVDATTFTKQSDLVTVTEARQKEILTNWESDRKLKLDAQLRNLPVELSSIFKEKTKSVSMSPDETKILYTASGSAELKTGLVSELPGSSTQDQERNIKDGQTYVYDIKEDRNFLLKDVDPLTINWFPTSRHLIVPTKDKVEIIEYDGKNRQTIYSGVYTSPHAYPFGNTSRLLILTNLGANTNPANLYSLTLK